MQEAVMEAVVVSERESRKPRRESSMRKRRTRETAADEVRACAHAADMHPSSHTADMHSSSHATDMHAATATLKSERR